MNLPTNKRPMRYLCTGCGAWRDGDANRLIAAGISGFEPNDPDAPAILSAHQMEMPFIERHGKSCHVNIRMIYPNDSEWGKLDNSKRED